MVARERAGTASRTEVLTALRALDWMMKLPRELDGQIWQEVTDMSGNRRKPYVYSFEVFFKEKGLAEGRAEGLALGKAEGLAEGEVAGRTVEARRILLRLLGRRFGTLPDDIFQRLQQAEVEDLERWADNVLDARSLAEVFG